MSLQQTRLPRAVTTPIAPGFGRAGPDADGGDLDFTAHGNQAAVQLLRSSGALPGGSDDDVPDAAARGLEGPTHDLPHGSAIQAAFGDHDVSGIEAHTAPEACAEMGAHAYASGGAVAFAGPPSLHTAAHEAAHVVQQQAGVQLEGGVGRVGDPYERHADAVADAVSAGRSAEPLLDASPGGGSGAAVQMEFGEGEDPYETGEEAGAPESAPGGETTSDDQVETFYRVTGESLVATIKANSRPATRALKPGEGGPIQDFPAWFTDLQNLLSVADVWTEDHERGRSLLTEYAKHHYEHKGQPLPQNVLFFLDYLGANAVPAMKARAAGMTSTAGLGGLNQASFNWCQAASTAAVDAGLAQYGLQVAMNKKEWIGHMGNLYAAKTGGKPAPPPEILQPPAPAETGEETQGGEAPAAGGGPLASAHGVISKNVQINPGDQVSYLYAAGIAGGHRVTAVEDRGASFVHVSGNTGGTDSVRLAESVKGEPGGADDEQKAASMAAADENPNLIPRNEVWIYDITRISNLFEELKVLDELPRPLDGNDPRVQAVLARFKLKLVQSTPPPGQAASP